MYINTPSAKTRRAAEHLWGEKTPAAPPKQKLRLISGKAITKGSLRFICTIGLPFGGGELAIPDVTVFNSHGKCWANLPSRPLLDQNGMHMTAENGKKAYMPLLSWSSKELRDRFSAAVCEFVRAHHPGVLDDQP